MVEGKEFRELMLQVVRTTHGISSVYATNAEKEQRRYNI